jgi:hypothetical protein
VAKRRLMERHKWETAIRCLEVALHPNTDDKEVIAGVNGFRRTADGTPLSDICRALAANGEPVPDGDAAKWRAKLERLNRDNIALRLRLEAEQRDAAQRQRDAEQRLRDATGEMEAAHFRADEAERRLAEFQAAYRTILDRAAGPEATRTAVNRPAPAPSRFQTILATAQQRGDAPAPAFSGGASNRKQSDAMPSRAPWTA